jgi:dihydrofolate reductase
MSKLAVVNFLSLDGVMQSVLSADEDREGGFDRGGWVAEHPDEAVGRFMSETTVAAGGMLLGRKTYQAFAKVWAYASEDNPAVAAMNRMPKYVASRTLTDADVHWRNTVVLGADIAAEVGRIGREPGPEIVIFGSGELIQTLAGHDLIDEYRLLVFPLVLGSGKRMFRDGMPAANLSLTDSVTTSTGVIISTYERRLDRV